MKNLIHSVKDWSIKKLGGYTAKEHQTISALPVHELTIDRRNVDHIAVRVKVEKDVLSDRIFPSTDLIKHELTRRLIPFVMERMEIKQIDDRYDGVSWPDSVVYEASIDVVRGN